MSVQARVEILRFWASGVWSERYVIVFEHTSGMTCLTALGLAPV